MKKLHKNELGFSAVEGLLIVLVLAVIGFGGYYVWHTQKTNKTSSATAIKSSSQNKSATTLDKSTTQQPTTSNVITSADDKVQLTLPKAVSVGSRVDGGSTCGFAASSGNPGVCITDISFVGSTDGYVKIFQTSDNVTTWHQNTIGDCDDAQNQTVNGNTELICTINPDGGKDYTISNGNHIVYFAGDSSSDFLSIISSTKFL